MASAGAAAAVAALQPRHVFGALGARPEGLEYVDEGTLAYLCGQSVVLYQPESRSQRFLAGSPEARITAFAVCPSRRLLALAEPGERATVTIYDLQTLKRRKILSAPAGEGTKEFVSLAFSGDGRYLAAQGGAPDWSLSLWVWEKSKLVASVRTAAAVGHTAVQCLFQPGEDPQYISVVGEGTCCLLAIEAGNTLRVLPSTLPRREAPCYACHTWLLDNDAKDLLAVGTRRGEMLIVGEGEVKQALQLGAAAGGIEALAAHSKGFVAGTSQGQLSTFERDSDNKPYRLGKTFAVDGGAGSTAATGSAAATGRVSASGAAAPLGDAVASTRVGTPGAATPSSAAGGGAAPGSGNAAACGVRACSLAVSPADDSVAVLTSDGQLLQLAAASGDRRGLFSGVQPLAPSFHSGAIVGLASCARRAVVATAGADRTIRIWNYQDKSAELVGAALHLIQRDPVGGQAVGFAGCCAATKSFDEEISSLALHPTGYLLLAGFADKLRLMTVLSDDLRLIKELPIKAAREACFSNGGQYFAVVNGNTVHVFCTYTGASLAVLRGHNGKVRGLWWSSDDTALVTAGVDGAVYEWRVLEGRRVRDFVQKGWTYSCVAGMHAVGANPSNTSAVAGGPNAIFAGAQDKKLRSLEEAVGGGLAVAAEVDAGAGITQVLAPSPGGRLLFAATEDGSLRSYKLPLTPECQAVRCSLAPVTCLAASRDESVLFAATADGALFVYDVKDRDAAVRMISRREGEVLPFAEEVLVGRGDINERRERMAELEAQVAEVTAQNEYQLKLKDLALNEKVRELTDKAASDAAEAAQRYNALLADRTELESRYEGRLRAAEEASAAQVVALDAQFQQKLIHEMERFQELQANKEEMNAKWEKQTAALVEQHARVVDELTAGHRAELAAERARYGTLAADKDLAGREAAEVRRQMEEDVDREVEELKERSRKQLQVESDANLRLKGENGLLRKRFDEQQKAIDEGKAQLRAAEADKRQLVAVIEGLRRDVAALQRDVAGRDEAIAEKEKRILDLKHKTQELEKFKFVLEYSIGELRAQLDPKDLQLGDMREKVAGMAALLAELGRNSTEVSLEKEGLRQREAALQKEIARQRAALTESANRIKQVQCDITLAVEQIQAPDQLKAAVVRLFRAHAEGSEGARKAALGEDPGEAAASSVAKRHIEMLERSVEQLKASLDAEKRSSAANHRRLVAENADLIKQLREAQQGASGTGSSLGMAGRGAGISNAPSRAGAGPSARASPSCCGGSTCDVPSPSSRASSARGS
ncbi:hypothetical protein ABPG75_012192 [Micractinium tetrahymenae]